MTERYSPDKWFDFVVKDTDYGDCRLDENTPPLNLTLPHGAKLCAMGLVLPDGDDEEDQLDRNQWFDIGKKLVEIDNGLDWAIGTWWAFGRHKYKDKSKIAKELKFSYGYLCNLGSVARRVPISSRNENVSFTHHMKVAKLTHNEQMEWLQRAAEQNWSAETLEQKIREEKKANDASDDDKFKTDDPDGYKIAQSRKKALRAQHEFEKITKGNPTLENCIDDILDDPDYVADLEDQTVAKLIKEATSVVNLFNGAITVLKEDQKRRAEKAVNKKVKRERLPEKASVERLQM